jgi:hypothetical protein
MTHPKRVYHVSEESGIERFTPRESSDGVDRVWSVSDARLHNYLLPRHCPRVTFYAAETTSQADVHRFLPDRNVASVVAIEQRWLQRVVNTRLRLYVFDATPFELYDAIAGYHTTRQAVEPLMELAVDDPLGVMLARDVEFRVLASLATLRAAVIESSLGFSIIRWHNAQEAQEAQDAEDAQNAETIADQ